jgi:protein SCO1
MSKRWLLVLVAALAVAACSSQGSSQSSQSTQASSSAGAAGTAIQIPVPAALRGLRLTNQRGHDVTLSSWRGRTVLLVPFLTLCQDICPLTTGNLLQVQQSLRAAGVASKVQIVELSMDPARDTPARLAAYGKLTGADWQLVTEPSGGLRALAKFFGFYYQKVPADDPDARDWWTGKPLAYDVDHTNNYFVIDPAGVERVEDNASPAFRGKLNPRLYRFLDELGRKHLQQAAQPDWTPADALNALGLVLHHSLAPIPAP